MQHLLYWNALADFQLRLPNVPLMSHCQFSTWSGNNYLSQIIINFLQFQNSSQMSNQPTKPKEDSKRKARKDYLYKIGKIKENNILCEKQNNAEFGLQAKAQKQGNRLEEIEQDFDLNMDFPLSNPKVAKKTQQTRELDTQLKVIEPSKTNTTHYPEDIPQYNQSYEGQLKSQQLRDISNKRIGDTFSSNKQQKQGEKQGTKNLLAQSHKPFLFQDFDLEEQENIVEEQMKKQPQKKVNFALEEKSSTESNGSEMEIKGLSITSCSLEGNVMIKITNKKQLILSRLPPGVILKCIVRKSSDIFNPQFDFYINNGMKHIISAKKYSLAKKQIFKLSMQLGKYRKRDIIGSIMANTVHSVYWFYKEQNFTEQPEYQIKATIKYEKMLKPGFREMKVQLFMDPTKNNKIQSRKVGHECSKQADLLLRNIFTLQKQNSSKNFSLFDFQDNEYQYLKMNKVSQNMFQVEIQHPLSPTQAFAICLTRFDAELK